MRGRGKSEFRGMAAVSSRGQPARRVGPGVDLCVRGVPYRSDVCIDEDLRGGDVKDDPE